MRLAFVVILIFRASVSGTVLWEGSELVVTGRSGPEDKTVGRIRSQPSKTCHFAGRESYRRPQRYPWEARGGMPRMARRSRRSDTKRRPIPIIFSSSNSDKVETCASLIDYRGSERNTGKVSVAMPLVDYTTKPATIILPMFKNMTVPLDGNGSTELIVDYYNLSMECLTLATTHRESVYLFNINFLKWIMSDIMPNLSTSERNLAMGGIMKIIDAMKCLGGVGWKCAEEDRKDMPAFGGDRCPAREDYLGPSGSNRSSKKRPSPKALIKKVKANFEAHAANVLLCVIFISWIFIFCVCITCILPHICFCCPFLCRKRSAEPDAETQLIAGQKPQVDFKESEELMASEELVENLSARLDTMAARFEELMNRTDTNRK